MDNTREVSPAVDALVASLTRSYGQIALILDHMMRNRGGPDAPPFDVVLRGLLCDVLAKLPDQHGAADIATAAQVVSTAVDTVAEEIYLVETDHMNRAARRAARKRGAMQ